MYNVFSITSFIPNGQRAEIFELTDNEVAVFKVNLPEKEFDTLKRKANFVTSLDIDTKNDIIKKTINLINNQNFNELFSGYNLKELLPELPIDENGHPIIDYKYYMISSSNFEYLIQEYYVSFIIFKIFNNDLYLNLIKVFYTLSGLEMSSTADENFMHIIKIFGKDKVTMDENGKYLLTGKEEDEDYYDFPFENDIYDMDLKRREFEEFNASDFKELLENYDFSKYSNITDSDTDEFDFKTKNATMVVELNR